MKNDYDRLHFYIFLGLWTFIWVGSVACVPCIRTSSEKEEVPNVQRCREIPHNSIKEQEGNYLPLQAIFKKSKTHIFPVEFDKAKTKRNHFRHVQPNKVFQETGRIIKHYMSKATTGKFLDLVKRDTSKAGSDKVLDVSNYHINFIFLRILFLAM